MTIYLEGRCRECGWRVTVDREHLGHTRDGHWCGPVEIDHPFAVPDEVEPDEWVMHPPAA